MTQSHTNPCHHVLQIENIMSANIGAERYIRLFWIIACRYFRCEISSLREVGMFSQQVHTHKHTPFSKSCCLPNQQVLRRYCVLELTGSSFLEIKSQPIRDHFSPVQMSHMGNQAHPKFHEGPTYRLSQGKDYREHGYVKMPHCPSGVATWHQRDSSEWG